MPDAATKVVHALATSIGAAKPGDRPITSSLSTSDRVLRRVTDGVYREPWAALRELISNAYDADATEVVIDTDRPRFGQISIRDNGMGFTDTALASMIKSIGGSPKRNAAGITLGVTDQDDFTLSPKGRKLIGKLGIGLFAVSQLTHEFQIITKRAGDDTRTIADVLLFRYREDKRDSSATEESGVFKTGEVRIWKVPAKDKKSQGTEIVLRSLLPRTRAELASLDRWAVLRSQPDPDVDSELSDPRPRPLYHIGLESTERPGEFAEEPALPWGPRDTDPEKRFRELCDAMFNKANDASDRRPSLENTFDNYFKFLWLLSLAAPLDYLDIHPFDLDASAGVRVFEVSNAKRGSATEVILHGKQTVRDAMGLRSPERGSNLEFNVVVDGVALRRPLRFAGLPKSDHAVQTPLLFVGKDRPDLSRIDETIRGGDLEFEAYLLWCPRIVPVEHNGLLVRVNDASGTLFDSTFLDYQISEQTRLRQVSSEVFVTEGMDAALNVDRESFNAAHPHYQYLSSWVHSAFKQFATRHKDIAKKIRNERVEAVSDHTKRKLERAVQKIVDHWTEGDERPVVVDFAPALEASATRTPKDRLVFSEDEIFRGLPRPEREGRQAKAEKEAAHRTMRGVAQVLYAAGVFDRMSREKRQRLLADLARVIFLGREQ
ncbi:MAG: ATP-binding protein [Fimbriimonadaceae bacterium]|nr:ATP-binding protein [Fimbriimonadaceae bacterium]